jgi:hypothetical protein
MKTKTIVIGAAVVGTGTLLWYLSKKKKNANNAEQQKKEVDKASAIPEKTGISKMVETIKAAADQGTMPIMKVPVPMPVETNKGVSFTPPAQSTAPVLMAKSVQEVEPIRPAAPQPVTQKTLVQIKPTVSPAVVSRPTLSRVSVSQKSNVIDQVFPQSQRIATSYKKAQLMGFTMYGLEGRIVRA